jgi:predicted restriction endonuclease
VLAKTGWRCALCGSTPNVQAHHVRGLRVGGSNDPANGIPLCARCHAKVEAKVRERSASDCQGE